MANPDHYDQICSRLPLSDPATKAVRDEFAESLNKKWPNNGLHATKYDANDLATMLVFSPFLQRLALRHGNDIADCLVGNNSKQILEARTTFINDMNKADCDAAAMQAIHWRGRSALAIALGDIAGSLICLKCNGLVIQLKPL